MNSSSHDRHMRRALELARATVHRTSPNPVVGCVLVRNGEIVGEGVTQPAGQQHAELMAIHAAGASARGADMYVTLEPCCHFGRTPPCTDAIIEAGVARVFTGMIDPNPVVHGNGLKVLEAAGIKTQNNILGTECETHHAPFSRFIRAERPWVILKAGLSIDGCISTERGDSKWITGDEARTDAHRWRARCDAVLVGAETARLDDPRLTVRLVEGTDPVRVVLDGSATLSADAAVFGPGSILFHAPQADRAHLDSIRATGAEVVGVPKNERGLDLSAVLSALAQRGVVSVLVEGGGRVHASFLEDKLADEACFYIAPKLLGRGRPVVNTASVDSVAAGWSLSRVSIVPMGDDVRIQGWIDYPDGPQG